MKKIAKISVSFLLVLCALWIAVPKVYVHSLFDHVHTSMPKVNGETTVESDAKEDCDFEKYDSPVFFTIFKFINNILPAKSKEHSSVTRQNSVYRTFSEANPPLRAPPVA